MRHLSLGEVLILHDRLLSQSGGSHGLRDLGLLESALAQPRMTMAGQDLYPDLPIKAAALGYSLIKNHPFVDGNKRIGHAAMATFLLLNGLELSSPIDEAEAVVLGVASSTLQREDLVAWVRRSVGPTSL